MLRFYNKRKIIMQKIYGRKPVLEAIKSGEEIEQIYIAFDQHGDVINQIFSAAKKNKIKVSQVSSAKFKEIEEGKNTQGVVALISSVKYFSLQEIINHSKKSELPFLLILDSIQDPHNLGAILRTAECAGVDGVILTTHESASINETVQKTSAGAASHLKICKIINLVQTIKELKDNGFWVAGSHLGNSKKYNEVDYKLPLVLIMGNEEKGIRELTAKNCDFLIEIPMKGKIQSLNVSVATGILLFEVLRNRQY